MEIAEVKAELERLHNASFGWAKSCCRGNSFDAEEVLQMVYLKILDGKARYRGESALRTWLFSVIRKTAITERRKAWLRSLASTRATARASQAEASYGPEAEIERSQMQQRFRAALQSLPARQRETLHLVFYEELSLSEAALVMSISVGSVRRHYERGKKRLRAAISREEIDHEFNWRRKENSSAVL